MDEDAAASARMSTASLTITASMTVVSSVLDSARVKRELSGSSDEDERRVRFRSE
jgi:hypothetical protein